MWVCFQLGVQKIKAEIGYYGHLFAMLIISGLQSKSIIDLASTSILHELIFSACDPAFAVLTKL